MNNKLTTIKKVISVITPFLLLTILIILLLRGCETKRIEGKDIVIDGVTVKQPTNNCRANFSGTLLSDEEEYGNISIIYQTDNFSEYVGEGKYPRGQAAFPKADSTSFDAIAIDHGKELPQRVANNPIDVAEQIISPAGEEDPECKQDRTLQHEIGRWLDADNFSELHGRYAIAEK